MVFDTHTKKLPNNEHTQHYNDSVAVLHNDTSNNQHTEGSLKLVCCKNQTSACFVHTTHKQ